MSSISSGRPNAPLTAGYLTATDQRSGPRPGNKRSQVRVVSTILGYGAHLGTES
jgi:hypothetical protein